MPTRGEGGYGGEPARYDPTPADLQSLVRGRLHQLAPFWPQLARMAARRGAGQDAEDIATDAIIRAAWSPTLDEQTPLPYLQRIVQNLVVDRYRDAKHRHRVGWEPTTLPRQREIDDHVADSDLAIQALRRLLATEGHLTLLLVWRRVVDEKSWSELAAETGMSPSQVQSRVWRAIRALRPWLMRQVRSREDLA